jgi:ankyrin repeat protein
MERNVKRGRLFAMVALPVFAGAMATAMPAFAQLMSPGYKFLEAVRKKEGAEVEQALGETGPTLINTRDATTGDTALHIVTARRDLNWLNFLLFKGGNPNIRNTRGVTPLSQAVLLGWVEGAELLIEKGARVDEPGDAGETPLINAVHMRNGELVAILLKAGADPSRADNSGRSARDYAALQGKDTAIAAALESAAKNAADRKTKSYGPSF